MNAILKSVDSPVAEAHAPSTHDRHIFDAARHAVAIEPVRDRRSREAFIRLPAQLYRNDPFWVPHLLMERRETLDPARNPFFEHGRVELFLARRGGEIVGRIAAIRNNAHNAAHHDSVGFFGFFECIDDQAVADRLLHAAKEAVRRFGLHHLRGPVSPSTNDEAGLLVEGFDDRPRFMMPYNPPYYRRLIENAGLQVDKQLLAYKIERDKVLASGQISRVARIARQRHGMTLRPLDMRRYRDEIHLIGRLYNAAWSENWGFVPITAAEIERMAKNLRALVQPSLVQFAEVPGDNGPEPVGVALVLPDYNAVLSKLDGRLLPFGWARLLAARRAPYRSIDWLRLLLIGILPQWRQRGFDAALYQEIARNSVALGVKTCEGSWVLEDNTRMNRILPTLGGEVYKRYNLYGTSV